VHPCEGEEEAGRQALRSIPLVAILTDIAIKQGPDVAKEIMERFRVALRERLAAEGWREVGLNVFTRA
jgi:hypothetical protein